MRMQTDRRFKVAFVSLTLVAAGCTGMSSSPGTPALLPDYRPALEARHTDLLAYFRDWLRTTKPVHQDQASVSYAVDGPQAAVSEAADRLLAGYEAFCDRNGGKIETTEDTPGQRCVNADGRPLGQLTVDVIHAVDSTPARLEFAVESGERVARLQAKRTELHARITEALAGNGPSGGVLLAGGEAFEVARFGRLAGPDYYAIQSPRLGLLPFSDFLSVRWIPQGLRVTRPDGIVLTETGRNLTPGRTLVRLVPAGKANVEAAPPNFKAPFRFVVVDRKSKQPRQIRVRDVSQIQEISVSPKPALLAGGPIHVRFDANGQQAFGEALVNDAQKAAGKLRSNPHRLDLTDAKLREDVERMGSAGACAKSQEDGALERGDIALSEYYVCAQYRKESKALLATDGEVTPESTPLVFLGRAARAPWFDFGGVLR
jgi:hypothetical protein